MTGLASIPESDRQASVACWYHAATLRERQVSRPLAHPSVALTEEQVKRATKRLERWKNQAVFRDPTIFKERLAMDSLSEQELFLLLAESGEQLQERMSSPATSIWLAELLQALSFPEEDASSSFSARQEQHPITFLDVFGPLIAPGRDRLRQGVEQLARTSQALPFDAETVVDLFQETLAYQVQNAALRAVVLEMHIARLEDRLLGATSQERFTNFLGQLSERHRLRAFLQEYPVLARTLVTLIERWANVSLELLQHLCADWAEICATLNEGKDPGRLVALQGGAGDTHRGGRSVAILRFSSGFQVVYKPRPLALDQHFQELLAWINARQTMLPLRTMTILPKGQHSWIEFVEVYSCETEAEVARLYERQGMYLALLYMLNAVDFHYENILAGEHPVLVDLEALFHPRFRAEEEEEATRFISDSVLRPIMLPQRLYLEEEEGEGLDLSGIGGGRKQVTPFLVSTWQESGTDLMHAVRERGELPEGQNRPRLRGQDIDELAYKASVLKGFAAMYRLLTGHRDELLTTIPPRFA